MIISTITLMVLPLWVQGPSISANVLGETILQLVARKPAGLTMQLPGNAWSVALKHYTLVTMGDVGWMQEFN